MGMSVDQVVIAKTSSGGCVFITIRWKDFICITYGSSDRLKEMMDIEYYRPHQARSEIRLFYGSNTWADSFG
jgi:hypothetical protein